MRFEDFKLDFTTSLRIPDLFYGEYRNPFDFLNEFDQWWEFEVRREWKRESTYSIISSMLSHDLARAAKSYDREFSSMKFTMGFDVGVKWNPKYLITGSA